ncbi:FtsQ-type POTRA domain-containing protein, partial [Gardnerella vaginalis]
SPFFRLNAKNIRIIGSNEWVSEQKIASIASNQVDKSLFLVSSQQIIEQLNNIPGVTETKVVKQFPQGLQITVRAQKPAAMLKAKVGEKLT